MAKKKKSHHVLTNKMDTFVEAYLGEAGGVGTQAARIAGYSGTPAALSVVANRLLKHPLVKQQIRKSQGASSGRWRTRNLRDWWRSVVEDIEQPMRERVKCSELLGKSIGSFIDRKQIDHRHVHAHVHALTDEQLAMLASREIRRLDAAKEVAGVLDGDCGGVVVDADLGDGVVDE